jgi:RNA polymerase sigma-70 factor (ECF subfamily)
MENQAFSRFFSDEGDWKEINKPKNWHEQENEQHLLDDNEFLNVLKKCLDALPENWSICVKLKYLSDKSGDEICQELDITPSNYWQIIHRAKLQLRECIEKNWFN